MDIDFNLEKFFSKGNSKGKLKNIELLEEHEYFMFGFAIYNYADPYKRNVRPFVVFRKIDTITYELYVFDSIQYSKKETFNFEDIIEKIEKL